ncbi:NifB/NifX family molybdenum-iron cluster-binding protein [Salidesulfovibrio onnuriiensis]|uniref:NifB/NifX family molybdenum-iron cluster-binding protein n=1 Tax=Salidesulfovibrio onnuriiensis TaxID=2583823 RepID=UPI0011C91586|nr:NifB/NifX family molybdenum-iron cluster-binding protein [Salidesulfovibrio onnuriiensis]
MRIAISANASGPDVPVEPRFGRAGGFAIYDTDSGEYGYHDNSGNAQLAQGAGIQAAQTLADQGVQVIITGSLGPKAWQALSAGGIRMVTVSGGSVREAVDRFLAGELTEANPGPANQGQPTQAPQQPAPAGGCRRTGGSGMGRGMGGGCGRGMGGGMGRGGGRGMGGGGRRG